MFKKICVCIGLLAACLLFAFAFCEAKTENSKKPENVPVAQQRNFIGDSKTKKYHKPQCKRCPSEIRSVVFDSPMSAQLSGYTPCKKCKPLYVKNLNK